MADFLPDNDADFVAWTTNAEHGPWSEIASATVGG
jgi:hypothetical protein